MNISSTLTATAASLTGSGTTASQSTPATSSVSPFLAQAEQRIQSDANTTSAQISRFGLLKSALSDGQTAAQSLSRLTSSTSSADLTSALGNFFNTFNASVSAANAASTATATDAQSARAKRTVQDLRSSLTSDPAMSDAMKKLGLTLQSDGSMVQDPKKFAASLSSDPSGTLAALAKVGARVDAVSSNELAATGSVGAALANLNAQSTSLTAQESALHALDQAMAAAAATDPFTTTDTANASPASTGLFASGLASYQSNMMGF